jgi:hypothetical protein
MCAGVVGMMNSSEKCMEMTEPGGMSLGTRKATRMVENSPERASEMVAE